MEASSHIGDQGGTRYAAKRATDLAERQFGPIARWQLLELGFSAAGVKSWVRSGRLFQAYPGVYALGRPGLSPEGELAAALLFAGRGAALGGITALWWLGLLERKPNPIHVDAPGRRASRPGVLIRHPREVRRSWHRRLPVAPLPEALLTASGELRHDTLRLVLARAEFRRLLDLRSLGVALGAGRTGTRALRAAMAAHLPQLARCTTPLETDFVLLCERHRLPLPEPNPSIGRYRPDMLWRDARLIVELDGRDAHSTSAQLAADARR